MRKVEKPGLCVGFVKLVKDQTPVATLECKKCVRHRLTELPKGHRKISPTLCRNTGWCFFIKKGSAEAVTFKKQIRSK